MTTVDERLQDVALQPGSTVNDYRELLLSGCALLDVRAPVEFNKGAFPTSVNLPLMSDEERHQVGIRYKQQGQDSAIALGAQLVTPDIQAQRVKAWHAFIKDNPAARLYCFRGGLRSRISQQWLAQAGVDVPLVEGGYKALRSFLITELERLCSSLSYILIGGRTGNGKTLLLKQLGPTVDLEHLANHRGSSFGNMPDDQPQTIDFENSLCIELMRRENEGCKEIFLEDEARLIGRICIPEVLRQVMIEAPIYILECEMDQRVINCFDDYVPDLLARYQRQLGDDSGFDAYTEHHRNSLSRIQKRFGGANYKKALLLLDEAIRVHRAHGDTAGYEPFIELLLRDYYDPMYDYQLSQKTERVVFKGTHEQILEQAAARGITRIPD